MALKIREGAVKRGTAEANWTDGDISSEPAGPDASESIRSQMLLSQKLMSKNVLVTLEQPWPNAENEQTVTLAYGREDATPIGPDTYRDEGFGTQPVMTSERLFTQGMGAAPRWDPGMWIHYHLRFTKGPLGKCRCGQDPETLIEAQAIMPAPVAREYFGDWEVPGYELRVREGQMVEDWLQRSWHRDRVAKSHWGGYEWDFPPGVPIYDSKGAVNYRAMRVFGPPKVPHVAICRLDTMMRRIPNTEARPWEIFEWGKMVEKGPRIGFSGATAKEAGLLTVTEDEFNRRVAQAVAAALAAQGTPKGKGT